MKADAFVSMSLYMLFIISLFYTIIQNVLYPSQYVATDEKKLE